MKALPLTTWVVAVEDAEDDLVNGLEAGPGFVKGFVRGMVASRRGRMRTEMYWGDVVGFKVVYLMPLRQIKLHCI